MFYKLDSVGVSWYNMDAEKSTISVRFVIICSEKHKDFLIGPNEQYSGFTKKDGRCLVSSATRDGLQCIAVTLNAPNDWNDHTQMLDYAFDNYALCPLVRAGEYLCTVAVRHGQQAEVSVVAQQGLAVPVKIGCTPDVKLDIQVPDYLEAPVGYEQVVGQVEVFLDDKPIGSVPAITAGCVAREEPKRISTGLWKVVREWLQLCASGRYFSR